MTNATRTPAIATAALIWSMAAAAATKPAPTPHRFPATPPPGARTLPINEQPWKGDFEGMVERRKIRVLVPYSRTLYYNDRGQEKGVTAEIVRDFERYINKKLAAKLGKRPITVYIIATTRDKLLSGLVDGTGDISAGNLTATPERLKIVDFIAPQDRKPVREIVVTEASAPPVPTAEGLSGRTVHVRRSSSYFDSLQALNGRLKAAGKAPVKIELVPDALEDEDLLEMVNAGLVEVVVLDDWKARIWAQILPKIRLNPEAAVRADAYTGWAYRKNSPELAAELQDFYRDIVRKQNLAEVLTVKYTRAIKQITKNTADAEWKRFQETLKLFDKYGTQYGFDPVMLAAQGYQESRLDQSAKSPVGAVGVMQVMPATGKELAVGDIHVTENNIHAGAKYMDKLMTRYFPDAHFSPDVRPLFAFASYNAGPGNISKMRKEAAKRGLDPDQWFNNVEIVVAEKIGIETTTYVRNIFKYYVAYRLQIAAHAAQEKARKEVSKGTSSN